MERLKLLIKSLGWRVKAEIVRAVLSLLVMPNRTSRSYGLNGSPRVPKITISLTSIPSRLSLVHLTIESVMRQTVKPDRIVLWLSKTYKAEEFAGFDWENLPLPLYDLQKRGLEIRFCEDTGSYRKLIHSIKQFPDDIVITIDDDVFYHSDTIEKLYKAYLKNGPDFAYCGRSKIMGVTSKGDLEPYENWPLSYSSEDNGKNLFFTGTGGVLYPPGVLGEEVLKEEEFLKLAPHADDVWFNAMCLLQGKRVFQIQGKEPVRLGTAKVSALGKLNLHGGRNDTQLKAVFDRYDLYKRLK